MSSGGTVLNTKLVLLVVIILLLNFVARVAYGLHMVVIVAQLHSTGLFIMSQNCCLKVTAVIQRESPMARGFCVFQARSRPNCLHVVCNGLIDHLWILLSDFIHCIWRIVVIV